MSKKILSRDLNFSKKTKPQIQKLSDDVFVVENFLPKLYEDIIEYYFLEETLDWELQEDVAFTKKESGKNRKGYSFVMANGNTPFPFPRRDAFHFIFPMVTIAFDCIGMEVKDFKVSRAFMTEPIYNDKEPIHVDLLEKHWVCLYYPHTIDGDTIFMKEKYPHKYIEEPRSKIIKENFKFTELFRVSPVKGRCVLFDGFRYHSSYRSKNSNRIVINTNVLV